MRENLKLSEITLDAYIALAYFGAKSLHEIWEEGELVAELPVELVRGFLAHGDADSVDIDDLVILRDLVGAAETDEEE